MKKRRALFLFALFLCAQTLAIGCAAPFSRPKAVEYYMPEYESPAMKKSPAVPHLLQVKLFNAAPPYRSSRMIYSDGAFTRQSYHYHKWRSDPADIVTWLLTRDFRNSGLFDGVFIL